LQKKYRKREGAGMSKRINRGISFLLVLVMFLSIFATVVNADQDGNDNSVWADSVILSAVSVPSGRYGGNLTARINISNYTVANSGSGGDISNVRVAPIIDSSFASVFEVTTNSYKERVYSYNGNGTIPPETPSRSTGVTENFTFKVRTDVVTGYYPIQFQAKYRDFYGDERSITSTIYVNITGKKENEENTTDKNIELIMGENQDTPFGAYSTVVDFAINMQNKGIDTAYGVNVSLIVSEDVNNFPFEITMANYDRHMGDMKSGDTVSIPYSMAIRKDVNTGYYPLKFNVSYRDAVDGRHINVEKVYFFRTQGKSSEEQNSGGEIDVNTVEKPRIIIESATTYPEQLISGEDFTFTLTMKNTSKTITATNILFTLDSELFEGNAVFSPLSGSNSVVVDQLAPNSSYDIVMLMNSKSGLPPKSYNVTVNQKYDIAKLKSIEDKASVAIPVRQVARLSVGAFEVMPTDIQVGSQSNIMFGINNTGKIALHNVNVIFQADSINMAETYMGNIEPGTTGNVDVMVMAIAPTQDDGKINVIIQYEDEAGELHYTERDFNLFVSEVFFMDDDFGPEFPNGGFPEENSNRINVIVVIVVVLIIGICAIITTVLLIKKKKQKQAMFEMEEEEEDENS
jgi:CARDB.